MPTRLPANPTDIPSVILPALIGGLFAVILAACGDGDSNNNPRSSDDTTEPRLSTICSYDASGTETLMECSHYIYAGEQLVRVV